MTSIKYTYTDMQEIANGAFGIISRAIQRDQNDKPIQSVAIKKIQFKEQNERNPLGSDPQAELEVMLKLDNIHIMKAIDHYQVDDDTFIVMPYHPLSLHDIIFPQIPVKIARSIAYQIFQGLSYMHENSFAHRDIKPSNIMISRTGTILLADLGQTTSNFTETNYCGTRNFRAPETLLSGSWNQKVDIFAAGLIIFELVAGRPLFTAGSDIELITQQNAIIGPFEGVKSLENSADWPKILLESGWEKGEKLNEIITSFCDDFDFKEVILGCLDCDQETRWTANEVMECNWCQKKCGNSIIQRFIYYQDSDTVPGRMLCGTD